MKKYDVVALGEILIDFVPDGKDRFLKKAGGAPLNFLATISRFGFNNLFIGKVGNDIFGRFLSGVLEENNVDKSGLKVDNLHNTTLAFVELNEKGDRDFSFYRNFGADTFISKEDIDSKMIEDSKVFHFGSLSYTSSVSAEATDYAIEIAEKSGCTVTYDPNFRASLWDSAETAKEVMKKNISHADITKLSKEEAEMITGVEDSEKNLDILNNKIVLITDGENGVHFRINSEKGYLPSLKLECVDTTGAGDIFFGTFVGEFLKTNKSAESLTFEEGKKIVDKAIRIAGKSTLTKGAISSIPKEISYEI